MEDLDRRLSDHSWFPDGTEVTVIGGRYAGDHGLVVNRAPDLRPGTVWVALAASGTHLVPANRLVQRDSPHSDTA
jgi:hypothetical protein